LICALAAGSAAAMAGHSSLAAEPSADQRAFAAEVAREGGPSEASVLATLAEAKVQQSILDAIARPAEATKPWKDYRPIFVTDKRVDDGVAFYRANRALLERIGSEYGVPPEVIVAIIGVETGYGRIAGKYRVLDALSTLAFNYPPRAKFFRGELKQLFLLKDKQLAYPIDELKGSYAGAMGWGQFMPTSIEKWAKDEDGDGRIDLWNSTPDILASVANYFAAHGWESGEPIAVRAQPAADAREIKPDGIEPLYPVQQMEAWGYAPLSRVDAALASTLLSLEGDVGPEYWLTFRNFYVITRYNKSPLYSMAVYQLAGEIADGIAQPAPALAAETSR
jgi:membrane-bound lytic murein transglycosylase B